MRLLLLLRIRRLVNLLLSSYYYCLELTTASHFQPITILSSYSASKGGMEDIAISHCKHRLSNIVNHLCSNFGVQQIVFFYSINAKVRISEFVTHLRKNS